MKRSMMGACLCLCFGVLIASPAYAGPRLKKARSEALAVLRAEQKLARAVARLSFAEKRELKKGRALGKDSDKDGIPDIVEGAIGSGRCDVDSDDDGVSDDSDEQEKTPGSVGGAKSFELKGVVQSFADPVVTIGGLSYTLASNASFGDKGFSKSDILPGVCVEVEGFAKDEVRTATKIKGDDDC